MTIRAFVAAIRATFATTEPPTLYCRTQWTPPNWTPMGTAVKPVLQRDVEAKKNARR